MRAKALLLAGLRSDACDCNDRQRPRAAVADALLHFSELSTNPPFIRGTEEDQYALADAQIFFVTLANVGFIPFKRRMKDLEAFIEQGICVLRHDGRVALIIDEIKLPAILTSRSNTVLLLRYLWLVPESLMDNGSQIFEKSLQQVSSYLHSGIHSQLMDDFGLSLIFGYQTGRNPQQSLEAAPLPSFDCEFVLDL